MQYRLAAIRSNEPFVKWGGDGHVRGPSPSQPNSASDGPHGSPGPFQQCGQRLIFNRSDTIPATTTGGLSRKEDPARSDTRLQSHKERCRIEKLAKAPIIDLRLSCCGDKLPVGWHVLTWISDHLTIAENAVELRFAWSARRCHARRGRRSGPRFRVSRNAKRAIVICYSAGNSTRAIVICYSAGNSTADLTARQEKSGVWSTGPAGGTTSV